jgi:predicted nuclease of predicted toxin-antitoxin system
MRLLADENLHAGLVEWLRSNGHDVLYAAESMAAAPDELLLGRARDEGRVVVTDDKDFGDLVVHRRLSTAGVLLLRLSAPSLAVRIARIAARWTEIERGLPGHLVVVSDRKVRVRPLPTGGDDA